MTIFKTRPEHIPAHISQTLDKAERARQIQLDQLPGSSDDLVLTAHRASVERILRDIRAAQRRLAADAYGVCTGCQADIPTERLELRPWTTACVRCAER